MVLAVMGPARLGSVMEFTVVALALPTALLAEIAQREGHHDEAHRNQ